MSRINTSLSHLLLLSVLRLGSSVHDEQACAGLDSTCEAMQSWTAHLKEDEVQGLELLQFKSQEMPADKTTGEKGPAPRAPKIDKSKFSDEVDNLFDDFVSNILDKTESSTMADEEQEAEDQEQEEDAEEETSETLPGKLLEDDTDDELKQSTLRYGDTVVLTINGSYVTVGSAGDCGAEDVQKVNGCCVNLDKEQTSKAELKINRYRVASGGKGKVTSGDEVYFTTDECVQYKYLVGHQLGLWTSEKLSKFSQVEIFKWKSKGEGLGRISGKDEVGFKTNKVCNEFICVSKSGLVVSNGRKSPTKSDLSVNIIGGIHFNPSKTSKFELKVVRTAA